MVRGNRFSVSKILEILTKSVHRSAVKALYFGKRVKKINLISDRDKISDENRRIIFPFQSGTLVLEGIEIHKIISII